MAFGYFGKMAGDADVIGAGLDAGFVGHWDAMLSAGLSRLRVHGGPTWPQRYFTAPMWRFAIAPGVCAPCWTSGVMMPSEDAAGEPYPLTLAWSGTAAPAPSGRWLDELEYLALLCLNQRMRARRLGRELAGLDAPGMAGGWQEARRGRVRFWTTDPVGEGCSLVEIDGLPSAGALAAMLQGPD